MTDYQIILGADDSPVFVPARYLNRHGLIAGATGTGKSVSAIGLAESLSRIGVPVFITDVKGDLSGMGAPSDSAACVSIPGWRPEAVPLRLVDVFQENGEPLTNTIAAMGAALVARALNLSDVQSSILEVIFALAEDTDSPLNTLNDLRELVNYCTDNRDEISAHYGLITPSSAAAISRAILRLERAGGNLFFTNRGMAIHEMMTVHPDGRGVVTMLDCQRLIREPRLYAAVLMSVLDTLAKTLPEVGDTEKPRFALILDEAHIIFDECPADLLRMIDRTVRLIRSKGVGIFFATQAPGDLPDAISRQLHLRIQHALRSVTPADAKNVIAAAQSMPAPEGFRAADVIGGLEKGQALVSFMGDSGKLTPARIICMVLPRCRLSPLSDVERGGCYVKHSADYVKPKARSVKPRAENVNHADTSDRNQGVMYIIVFLLGLMACVPWASLISPAAVILPAFIMAMLYMLPIGAALGIISGLAKGRHLNSKRR